MRNIRYVLSLSAFLLLAFPSLQAQEKIEDGTNRNFKVVTERAAGFPGGNREMYMHMFQNMRYPKEAKAQRIEGDIMVSFFVEADSTTSEVKALKDLGAGTKAEAERLVKSMKFIPALQGGKAIRQSMMISVLFRIYD